jgi:hypothetical protein
MNQGELAPSIMADLAEKSYGKNTYTQREKILTRHNERTYKKEQAKEREQERTNKDK